MWRKGNLGTLLLGMQLGVATMKNNMEFVKNFRKIKNRTTI